ncbi:MAG: ATP-binding protein [Sedimentisphaerales bacterium]
MGKKRLIWHLYPVFLIIIVAVLLAAVLYTSHFFRIFYYNQIANDLNIRARIIKYQIEPMIKSGSFSEIEMVCKSLGAAGASRITIILPDGRVIGDSDKNPAIMENHSDRAEFKTALKGDLGKSVRFSDTLGKKMMYLAIPIRQDNKTLAVVRTSVPVTIIDNELTNLHKKILWTGIVIAVCSAAASWVVSKRLTRPIEQMTETAQNFASGDFEHRLAIPDTTELAELAYTLNEMAQQLAGRIETITRDKNETQAILSSMIEGVLAVDYEGHIVSINNAAAELLKINKTDAHGKNIEEIVRNPQFIEFVKNTLTEKQPAEADISLTNNGGHFLRLHGTALTDSKEQKTGAVIVLHDITRIRQLEEIRSDFVANVSHELKTPITSIKGFVETLLEGVVKDPVQVRRFLNIIAKHSERLDAIINDLLALSRLEEDDEKRKLSFEEHHLKPVLASAIELSKVKAEQKSITVELVCSEEITAKINSALVEQAVINLIDNAVKYSPENSTVIVNAQKTPNDIVIKVIDQGCGIERQHLPRIFERFYVVDKARSRKLGGTGLGLAIVKHISNVHGGNVTVESSPGSGSSFTIHLPASPDSRPASRGGPTA